MESEITYARMAAMCGFSPCVKESWPINLLDKLIFIEKRDGHAELLKELRRIFSHR